MKQWGALNWIYIPIPGLYYSVLHTAGNNGNSDSKQRKYKEKNLL